MGKINNSRHRNLKLVIYFTLSVAFLSALAMPLKNNTPVIAASAVNAAAGNKVEVATTWNDQLAEESKAAFNDAYTVLSVQEEFVMKVKEWIAKGATVPDK